MSEYSFKLITGCMFSGKSNELIRLLTRAEIANKKVIAFSPTQNTRDIGVIKSRGGGTFKSYKIRTDNFHLSSLIESYNLYDYDIIGIDEIQFFDDGIIDVIKKLISNNKRLVASGLDLNYKCETFGCMGELLTLADSVVKLSAVCMKCGSDHAIRTQRLIKDDNLLLIDDNTNYEARCLRCFVKPE